jgi:hypothetical protein
VKNLLMWRVEGTGLPATSSTAERKQRPKTNSNDERKTPPKENKGRKNSNQHTPTQMKPQQKKNSKKCIKKSNTPINAPQPRSKKRGAYIINKEKKRTKGVKRKEHDINILPSCPSISVAARDTTAGKSFELGNNNSCRTIKCLCCL